MLNILLIRALEPLPLDSQKDIKKLRTAMLADALVAKGHSVTWVASTFNHFEKSYYFEEDTVINAGKGMRYMLFHTGGYTANISFGRIRHHRLFAKRLKNYLRDSNDKYDLIVASLPTIEAAYEGVKYGMSEGIPVAVDVRDKWPDTFNDYVPSYLSPLVSIATMRMNYQARYCFKHATLLTTMSDFMLDWAVKKSNRTEPSKVFYLGSSLDPIKPMVSPNLENKQITCAYVGSIISSYDLTVVIEASLKLPEVQFIIAGEGPMLKTLKSMTYGNNVKFLGWCKKDEVVKNLCDADILLLPVSKFVEPNMPNKLFDYLWAGKPILASINGEAADLISHHELGYVFKHHDVEDFIKGVKVLSSSDKRQIMKSNIKHIYAKYYSASSIYENFVLALEKLCKQD